MSEVLRRLTLIAISLVLAQCALAEQGINGNLADVHWLEKNLKNPNLVIIDVSPPQMFAANHVPGAISVSIYDLAAYGDVIAYGTGSPKASAIEKQYQSWGISPGKKVVVYDQGGTNLATSAFFNLSYHGFPEKDLFILDGGMFKWQKEGLPVTKEPTPAPKSGTFKVGKANTDIETDLPEFLAASGDTKNNALVDGLGPEWYFGVIHPFSKAGHIPGGLLTAGEDFYNADKTFKSPEEIKRIFTFLGVRPEQQIYTYCGGGVAATVPFFAARYIAHYPRVKVYSDSELGWISDQRDLPLWTYGDPMMMRDSNWMQFRGGRMLHSFIDSHVSMIDVRPAAVFSQGHVPFALNIPADVFKSNMNDAAKLAAVLGPAGVNVNDEAVVISGSGLTPEAALAYVALEKLGQRKVSVLLDSAEKWPQPGYEMTKEPTLVRPKKGAHDPAIAPTEYPVNLRDGVLINDANRTQGFFPRLYIASGKDMPAKTPDGKVVHVAYTELVNADGTPKAAKDIWMALAKAGVSRYSEIILIADDPGDAAVNFYILKLMGFRDVKVLAD
jgi:thiosulfate/3-mercaptopyruvate sulfurtransferase